MNDELTRQQQLLELLKSGSEDAPVDKLKLRYALYARKSTIGEDKQASSVEDQIKECMEKIITPQGLNLVGIYNENASAKIADTREEFKRLINDINIGRIDGLICWHPDRLSRNMKEAGTVIDLVDRKMIKDMQFSTFRFEDTPAGKMLLGITFVMAKNYSEHVSESVDRGNRLATKDGEFIGKFKHGYVLDTDRHFQPDPDNFTKVKHMFQMALEHKSQKDIRLWINDQNYKVQKKQKTDPVSHTWSKDDVSELLRDPFYAGVLRWGKNFVTLAEVYGFESVVSVEEFQSINKIDSLDSSKIVALRRPKGGEVGADLLRGCVYCGHCRESLSSMTIPKRKDGVLIESRYYWKCETLGCPLYGKSARAKFVIDVAQNFLTHYLFVTEKNYAKFMANAKARLKQSQRSMDSTIQGLKIDIANKHKSYERVKKLIEDDNRLKKHYDLDKSLSEIEGLVEKYEGLLETRKQAPDTLPTYEEYLKLFESTPVILNKIRDMKQMDSFIRIFFSNFTITATGKDFRQGSEVSYKLKEPWSGFVENGDFSLGAG